jgi:hypothetical protein
VMAQMARATMTSTVCRAIAVLIPFSTPPAHPICCLFTPAELILSFLGDHGSDLQIRVEDCDLDADASLS